MKHQATIDYLSNVVIPRIDATPWCDVSLQNNGAMCLIGYLGVVEERGHYLIPDEDATIKDAVDQVASQITLAPYSIDSDPIHRCWNYNDRHIARMDDPRQVCKRLVEDTITKLKKEQQEC